MRSVSLAEQLVVVDVLVNKKKYDCGHEFVLLRCYGTEYYDPTDARRVVTGTSILHSPVKRVAHLCFFCRFLSACFLAGRLCAVMLSSSSRHRALAVFDCKSDVSRLITKCAW